MSEHYFESPQCPHEAIRATCPGCTCECVGCVRHNEEWERIEAGVSDE